MAKLLFKLRDVPEDEAHDIRELLTENDIAFYETHAGNWGIAMAAIWLKEEDQFQVASELIEQYQKQRSEQFHNNYRALQSSGQLPTLMDNIRANPLRFAVYIFSIIIIIYFSVIPFINI